MNRYSEADLMAQPEIIQSFQTALCNDNNGIDNTV